MKLPERTRKTLCIIAGTVTLVLGTLGLFLPLLPTTPFYLLTAWLYMRGSQRMYNAVMRNKYFGRIVRDFSIYKSISVKTKVTTIVMLWVTISISAFVAISLWWVRIILFAIAVGVSIHVLSYKTRKKDDVLPPPEEGG